MGVPQGIGLSVLFAYTITLIIKMFISEEKPFTKKWFIDIVSFIPPGV
jgi:hypothetical protein